MGVGKSRPARAAPVRYVARAVPRNVPIEDQFKKLEFTAKGINTNTENVNTEPTYYTETSKDENSTTITDHTSPRWYLNTFMDLMDSSRQERVIISGNLPVAWERDKFEPYALVRNRIDDEDMKWVLSPENKKTPIDQLVEHTKLDRQVLQDILDTVELPRTQYRNHKGKLTKSLDDTNEFLAARKEQMAKSKELETLKRIGYSPEELEKEEQYLTKRTRGMKTLDELGASARIKARSIREKQREEMDDLLEARRTEELESGKFNMTEEMLAKPENAHKTGKVSNFSYRGPEEHSKHFMYNRSPSVKGDYKLAKLHWWLEQSRRISRSSDKIHGVPQHNKQLQMDQKQFENMTIEAAHHAFQVAQSEGKKGFIDPRDPGAMDIMRAASSMMPDSSVDVHPDAQEPIQFQWAHTKHHKSPEGQRRVRPDEGATTAFQQMEAMKFTGKKIVKDEKIERDINAWLKHKFRNIEQDRLELLTQMELDMSNSGRVFDINKIPENLRNPIYLDDEGNAIKPPTAAPAAGTASEPAQAPSDAKGHEQEQTSPSATRTETELPPKDK